MFKDPKRVFTLLVILAIGLAIVDLPENLKVRLPWGADIVVNPPIIELPRGMKIDFRTRYGLDLAGGTHLALEADMKDIKATDRADALESAKQVIERRVNFFGVSEPVVQSARSGESYRIVVELPGVTDVDQAVNLIGQTAKLEFRELGQEPSGTEAALFIPTIANTKPVGVTGKDLKRASLSFSSQTGAPEVAFEFNAEGGKKFGEVTRRLVGKTLAIFLDDILLTAPRVNSEISEGTGVIQGSFTVEGAKTLALQLNAGALPVPVSVVEKRSVGATLGAQSIAKSVRAGLIGLGFVAVFMFVQYGKLGLIADLALVLYGLITLALYRIIPVTLTLPGIAGFILSIGMAVDSNILIFERYKEEVRKGKPWRIAMELGFGKAWDSIRDANLTTIMTALILYNPGNWAFLPSSGMVRGFAATLFLGVVVSLFTGIVATRTFIRVLYRPKGVTA